MIKGAEREGGGGTYLDENVEERKEDQDKDVQESYAHNGSACWRVNRLTSSYSTGALLETWREGVECQGVDSEVRKRETTDGVRNSSLRTSHRTITKYMDPIQQFIHPLCQR